MGQPHNQDPGGPIVIGLRDLYTQLQALDRSMSALTANVQMNTQERLLNTQSFAQQLADFRHDMNDHETRIRIIESRPVVSPKSMWIAVGTLTPIIAIIVTIIIAIVLNK